VRKIWIAAGIAVALTGCGGGSSDETSTVASTTTTSTTVASTTTTADTTDTVAIPDSVPKPAQPITELAAAVDEFGTQGDCAQAVALINQADLPDPEGADNPRNCNAIAGLISTLSDFKSTDSAEFGSAGLLDGTNADGPIAIEAVLDQSRSFKLTGGTLPGAQIGTEPRAGIDFEAPAAAFVKALRDGDCKAAHSALVPVSRLAYADEKQFCSVFDDNFMAAPEGLGARLQADPDADLVDLGGTQDAHFYGLPTTPAGYRTILVGKAEDAGGTGVFDVAPVER
jgi:hypothetical protein